MIIWEISELGFRIPWIVIAGMSRSYLLVKDSATTKDNDYNDSKGTPGNILIV